MFSKHDKVKHLVNVLEWQEETSEITHCTYHSDPPQHSQPWGSAPLHSLRSGGKAERGPQTQQYISALNNVTLQRTIRIFRWVWLNRQVFIRYSVCECVYRWRWLLKYLKMRASNVVLRIIYFSRIKCRRCNFCIWCNILETLQEI